ncbi:MAG: type VI secretion system tip protein VgrG, partial [Deltaproteobacteria bacterium]|nr:type VI secretion system tip protein VgrG [Deltaproteobacteria bacterium]
MMLVAKALHDALPPDAVVMRLSAREAMSELFIVDVEVACTDATLDLASFAWSTMAVVLAMDEAPEQDPRWFHGIVEEARLVRSTRLATYYRFRLRPLVHGLDYRVRTRLFQEKCAVDVVKQVLSEAGLADDAFVWATSGQDPVRELCMQYREAELAFVLRLLEDEGIYYWFEHDETGHRMHLTDDGSGIALIDGSAVLTFTERQDPDTEHITDVRWSTDLCSDAHITRDWSWENPNDVVESEQSTPTAAGFTRYEYPGGFRAADDGGRRALARLRESTLSEMELVGRTACRRLSPGRIFGVVGAQPSMIDGDYLIVSVRHEYAHIEGAGRGPVYAAHVRAIPSSHPFAPPRVTPKPRVAGKESAVITGPAGEEIHVDSMGRVKVHFYFDRENPVDDTASCWVRTQQVNLGGSMVLPRLGWEVSVGFQEGDPDRPVVMQKLYNRETLPPLSLPAEKTKTALESTSSPGGGNTNSIIMGDAGGAMTFAMHASKKLMVMAGNDMSRTVKVNRKAEIGIHDNLAVVGDETVEVSGTQTVSVTANTTLGTTASKTVTIKGAE